MSQSYEQFGKYLLIEKVAAGGMAEIYLSRSCAANGLNKFFAIKRILPQFSTNEDFVNMFKEEAKVAINLNHSNVATIFDFGMEKGQFYIVMDYIEGRNLRQIINELKKSNKSFSIDQSIFLIKEAAAGLDHAHRCTDATSGKPLNITHRDMSPQNIMVSFEGEVKVIDFGIAKTETEKEDTKSGTLKGKFSYMSPEQAEGQSIDPRTDVFALGIVLWELLANDRLFTGSNEAAILRKVRDCQVPPIRKINPTVPAELERIVMKSLAKDRNVRYQTAANLHRDLNRFLNTQYPDFSPQDFSQFVKECFKTAFQEGRDKLVKYSKIEVEPAIELAIPSPKIGGDDSAPSDEPKKSQKSAKPSEPSAPLQGLTEDQNVKIKLDGLRQASPTVSKSAPTANKMTPVAPVFKSGGTQVSQVSYSQSKPSKNSSEADSSDIILKAVLFVALAFGGWWGYKNYMTPQKPSKIVAQKNLPDTQPVDPDNSEVQETQQSSVAAVKVSVNSSPEMAEILVNGQSMGQTPAVISVDAGKDAEIVIRKEGYLDYTVKRPFKETSQLFATLQSNQVPAYLNIKVSDANTFTKISINGKELLEKPPIVKYPIMAQKETVISAYNPITKQSDEITVNAKPGESVEVQLILGRKQKK